MRRIGLVSDTHGLVRPEALDALAGCERIVHAGDLCDPSVLARFARVAPVTAVRGNNDRGDWADALAVVERLVVDGVSIVVVHDLADLDLDAPGTHADVVVSGHSHQPSVVTRAGVLFVNPGSAGPRRFRLPVSVGELRIDAGRVEAVLTTLHVPAARARRAA